MRIGSKAYLVGGALALLALAVAGAGNVYASGGSVGATLNVTSSPPGVTLAGATCYTVTAGTCGTTDWTSTNPESIPVTTYTYPTTAVLGGLSYTLVTGSLTGCNAGGSLPGECKVSVPPGAAGPAPPATISATYKRTPPSPVPSCAAGAPNLVQNASFESVTGAGVYTGGSATWWYIKTPSTTMVPHWTRDSSNEPIVFSTPATFNAEPAVAAFQGTRFVGMDLVAGAGVRGELSAAPQIGQQYVLSARIQSRLWPTAGTVTIRLRNSGSGAQSAAVAGVAIHQSGPWVLIGGSVLANGYYNRVVLRYSQGGGTGYVDAVRVCKAMTKTPSH